MECDHDWKTSKIWVKYERTFEEPEFYPPSGLSNLEICIKCGVLRVPLDAISRSLKEK